MTVTSGHTHTEGQRKTTENRERHPVGAQRCTKDPESSEEAQTRGRKREGETGNGGEEADQHGSCGRVLVGS